MDWIKQHGEVIRDIVRFVNKNSQNFILKGGTALKQCYKLDCFSEVVYFDALAKDNIIDLINKYVSARNYSCRIAKETETTKRCFVNYGNAAKPLKIETSYRTAIIEDWQYTTENGIVVYTIDQIALQKAGAYLGRDKIRDLYDLTFICKYYDNKLSRETISQIRNAFSRKGLEQFDYLLATQEDNLIDKDKLANDFLDIFNKLGLISEKKSILDTKSRKPSQILFESNKSNNKSLRL